MANWRTPMEEIKIGTGRKLKDGDEIAILTLGHVGNYAVEVCHRLQKKNIETAHYDMRFAKPVDEEMLHEIFSRYKKIITVEDGCVQGGFGSAILEFMADNNYSAEVKRLGIPDRVIEHGEQIELQRECGFDPDGIEKAVIGLLESISRSV
jgi:1-deoxy-D-xylulose-5-phosphate synthase